jgi:RNA polymerase sigma factor (sigma-70 family)
MEESSDLTPERLARQDRGRRSVDDGASFEQRVSEIYRLLHYDVEPDRLFSGRQVDLFLTGRFGDLVVYRAIECKSGTVGADEIDSFVTKLRLVRSDYPSAIGTVISLASFTAAVKAHAAREGIQLTLFRDLAAQLFDGQAYARGLVRHSDENDRYPLSHYVEPAVGYETTDQDVPGLEVIDDWLRASDWNQLTLLGDVGTGKSFLSRVVTRMLADRFLASPLEHPVPVLIDLREADRQFSLEGLVLTHLAQSGLQRVSFEAFQYAMAQGQVVLILDGFDEMAARVTPQVTARNFSELTKCVKGRAKVMLTCRTHYFKSRTEEEEVVLGVSEQYESETARDLYFDLISRAGFRIAYLRPFTLSQIESYVRKVKPATANEALEKIRRTYNLIELSQRPMLLEMIVKSIDRLQTGNINQATLYSVFTDAWVHRDRWRDVLKPEAKLRLLMKLAHSLWSDERLGLHYSELLEYVRVELAGLIQSSNQLVELDSEIRTASFLTRDGNGNYAFAHKSYGEYFLAKFIAQQLAIGDIECLRIKRISPEVVGFVRHLCDWTRCEPLLEQCVTTGYALNVSENALLCLYGVRRSVIVDSASLRAGGHATLVIQLPSGMRLAGAQLGHATLEGAVMTDADLSGASLSDAVLSGADLRRASLSGAMLNKAQLVGANLQHTVLSAANASGANLDQADISWANLSGADLSDAFLGTCKYEGVAFETAKLARAIIPDELSATMVTGATHDEGAFGEGGSGYADFVTDLTQRVYPRIRSHVRYLGLVSDFDGDDIAQETMVRLIRSSALDRFKGLDESQQLAYAINVARNIWMDRMRTQHRRDSVSLEDIRQNLIEDHSMSPFDNVRLQEADAAIRQVLETLQARWSDRLKRIVFERFSNGRSYKEIALQERLSVSGVQRMVTKAREEIRVALTAAGVENDTLLRELDWTLLTGR